MAFQIGHPRSAGVVVDVLVVVVVVVVAVVVVVVVGIEVLLKEE